MTLPTRQIRFTPLKIDGSGAPSVVAIGWYLVEPTAAYDDGTGRVERLALQVDIPGTSVIRDLAITPVDYSWAWKVTGKFPDNTERKGMRVTEEYVAIPSGTGILDFEDLPRVDPTTLGPISTVTPAVELRIQALEAAIAAGGGSGGGAPPGTGTAGRYKVTDLEDVGTVGEPIALANSTAVAKTAIGLGSVDNTADTAKPVSTVQQTALNLKANLASPPLTGVPTAPTAAAGTSTTQIATTAWVSTGFVGLVSPPFTGTPTAPTAAATNNTTQLSTTAFVKTVSADVAYGPANSSLTVACTGGVGGMVTRPTTRTDVIVYWKCPNVPVGGGYPNAESVDIWLKVVP